jgi:DNA-binding IclR family transcriptional regulator
MARKQRSVQSLEVGGQLLLALSRSSTPLALKDLAREAKMTPARAHPYLVSFGKLNLIEQDPVSGRYDLGTQALHVGLATLQRLHPLKVAREELERQDGGVQFSSIVSIWGNLGPTTISFLETDYPVNVYLRPGTVVSLLTTATGQVFAAHMPKAVLQRSLKYDALRYGGRPEPLTMSRLESVIAEVRTRGVARNVGMTTPGVVAVSAPAFDHEGTIALAITFIKPGTSTDTEPDSEIVRTVIACANRISQRLGYPPR